MTTSLKITLVLVLCYLHLSKGCLINEILNDTPFWKLSPDGVTEENIASYQVGFNVLDCAQTSTRFYMFYETRKTIRKNCCIGELLKKWNVDINSETEYNITRSWVIEERCSEYVFEVPKF